jgi:hypothetical protein
MSATTFHIPVKTSNGLNARGHWAVHHRRARREREAAFMLCPPRLPLPCVVTMTRVSPGTRAMDDDNLQGALKCIRDGTAKRLGVDDASPLVMWRCEQRRGDWGVDVRIEVAT